MHAFISRAKKEPSRRGVASLDYIIVLSGVFLFLSLMMSMSARLIGMIYRMISSWVSWPFL